MSRAQFFPYPVAEDALALSCVPASDEIDISDGGRILARGVTETGSVRVTINVTVAEGILDRLVPPDELNDAPVALVVTLHSIASRRREAVRLERTGDSWALELDIPKAELAQEVRVEPRLIRTTPGHDSDFAEHVGAILATGEGVAIEIDESHVPAGGYLDIRFENFQESGNILRSQNPDLLFTLDTDRETPVLWLNEGIEHFKKVALTKAPRGANLRVRDATFDTVVSQVWTSLVSLAIGRVGVEANRLRDADDGSDPLDSLSEWEQRVINFWAPQLYDGTRPEAIAALVEAAAAPALLPELYDKLSVAVQRQARTVHAFRGLIRLRDREGV